MKTYSPKPEHIERRWYVLDAGEQVLGRVATEAAVILRGKHKPIFAPHMDVGDYVIIINASKVVLTGGKETKKIAWRHSGHPGGITGTLYEDLLAKKPAFAVEKAVQGHASEEPSRSGDDQEAPRRPGAGASPPGAEACGLGDGDATRMGGHPRIRHGAGERQEEDVDEEAGRGRRGLERADDPREEDRREDDVPEDSRAEDDGRPKTAAKKPTAAKATARKKPTAAKKKTTATKKPTATKATARKTTAKKPAATSTRKKKES